MRSLNTMIALALIPLLLSTPAFAQTPRIVDTTRMTQALADKADEETRQRTLVRRVLDREDVRDVAQRMGLNAERADAAVATLSGEELSVLAGHASAIETQALAGGASTLVISTTTLLLILIVVILLAN